MNNDYILKCLLIIGGVIEVIIGIFFLFLPYGLSSVGLSQIPLFCQMAGTFLLGFGIILTYSSKDLEAFKIVPLTNILIRFLVVGFSILSIPEYHEFIVILIPAMIYDISWSVVFLYLMKKQNLLF